MDNKILIGGLVIAIIIAVLAPFLASSNPDGLESTAEKIINENALHKNLQALGLEEEGTVAPSPMPDYAIEGMGKAGEVIAMIIGTLMMLALAYGVAIVLKKPSSN
jgi:cobalt/nickel transport protein